MRDIQFQEGREVFGCRVSGICVKDNRIFLSKLKTDRYWTFVGGKVAFGESTEEAILREYREEVGAQLQIGRLIAFIENFFDFQGCACHQYIFFYELRDGDDALEFFSGERVAEDNQNLIYRWFDLDELSDVPLKPDCAREILQNLSPNIQHHINREN